MGLLTVYREGLLPLDCLLGVVLTQAVAQDRNATDHTYKWHQPESFHHQEQGL